MSHSIYKKAHEITEMSSPVIKKREILQVTTEVYVPSGEYMKYKIFPDRYSPAKKRKISEVTTVVNMISGEHQQDSNIVPEMSSPVTKKRKSFMVTTTVKMASGETLQDSKIIPEMSSPGMKNKETSEVTTVVRMTFDEVFKLTRITPEKSSPVSKKRRFFDVTTVVKMTSADIPEMSTRVTKKRKIFNITSEVNVISEERPESMSLVPKRWKLNRTPLVRSSAVDVPRKTFLALSPVSHLILQGKKMDTKATTNTEQHKDRRGQRTYIKTQEPTQRHRNLNKGPGGQGTYIKPEDVNKISEESLELMSLVFKMRALNLRPMFERYLVDVPGTAFLALSPMSHLIPQEKRWTRRQQQILNNIKT